MHNDMVLHIIPSEDDFETVYQSLKKPAVYLALGRHEDVLDIKKVEIVELREEEEQITRNDIYIPVDSGADIGNRSVTLYTLTKEYEITKQGLRRWKADGGKVRAHYFPHDETVENVLVDTYGDVVAPA